MADLAIGGRVDKARDRLGTQAAAPTGGWITLLLHVLVMVVTANSIVRVDQSARTGVLVPLAVGGLLLGYFLSKTPALDAVSHILALVVGAAATFLLCAARVDGAAAIWDSRGRVVYDLAERIVLAQQPGEARSLSDDDLLAVIGVTLWLVGYSSAWMLYRRRWLLPALVVPATLFFVSLRFEDAQPTGSLAVLALSSLIMAARHHAMARQLEWSQRQVPSPRSLPARFTASGVAIAAFAVTFGWMLPFQAPQYFIDAVADRLKPHWEDVEERVRSYGFWPDGAQAPKHSYSEFSDSFVIGQIFVESETPVATYDGAGSPYFALRRYDYYTGHGWKSNVDERFRMDGEGDDTAVSTVTFTPNQSVPLSGNASQSRIPETGVVTVLHDQGGLVFTTDIFLNAEMNTFAIMGWEHYDNVPFNLASVDPNEVHIHLHDLVQLLKSAEFTTDPATGQPVLSDPKVAHDVDVILAGLSQLPIETSYEFDDNGNVVLLVSGRLPIYDDIEAVFDGSEKGPAQKYYVTGDVSLASEADLRLAGATYPTWVTDRYLVLPYSVTDETRQLASEVVNSSGANNVFDMAWAIQEHLRSGTYTYVINSEAAPDDRDTVDYFLFGDKVGRCEEYATAMVVMLRSQGIPARLVAGFRNSDERTETGELLYREKQAHTWVEVFFPGYGWVPFEPTPSQAPFGYGDDQGPINPQEPPPTDRTEPEPTPEPTLVPSPEATPEVPFPQPSSDDSSSGWGERLSGGLGYMAIGITVLVAAIVAFFAVAWVWSLRGMRPGAS
jgi:transglutaminase-like putative cysteine protease